LARSDRRDAAWTDHRTTLVGLDHNAIRAPTAIGIDRPLRPFVGGIAARLIIDEVEVARLVNSAGDNASLVGALGSADGWIDGDNNAVQPEWRALGRKPRGINLLKAPKSAGNIR
jgi:hypothetical protein